MCLRIGISSIFLGLYIVWVIWGIFCYFFFFEFIIILIILQNHYVYKKHLQRIMTWYQGMFEDEDLYWMLMNRYAVYIYASRTAESIATSFTISMLAGYLAMLTLLIMQRWSEAAICFANAVLCEFMSAWLNPIPFLTAHALKNEDDDSCNHLLMLEHLQNLVAIDLLFGRMDATRYGKTVHSNPP